MFLNNDSNNNNNNALFLSAAACSHPPPAAARVGAVRRIDDPPVSALGQERAGRHILSGSVEGTVESETTVVLMVVSGDYGSSEP